MSNPLLDRQALKENLILIDSDLKDDLWVPKHLLSSTTSIIMLDGFSVGELIVLYKRASVIIDLHFNGPERTCWEAILFDCYPVVSHQGNGGDDIDIPIPAKYKVDAYDADLDHSNAANVGNDSNESNESNTNSNTRRSSDLFTAVDHILANHAALANDFAAFKTKVIEMPVAYRNSIEKTFSSSAVIFVLGGQWKPALKKPDRYQSSASANESPRIQTQTRHGEVRQRETNIVACLISILYHLPLSSIIIHVPHVFDFLQRWQRLWRELSELGLSDKYGGGKHHSVRVLPPRLSKNDTSAQIRGDVSFTVDRGAFLLLGTETMMKVTGCLQSHAVGEEAGLLLNEGTTLVVGTLRRHRSANRLNSVELCQLDPNLADMLDISSRSIKLAELKSMQQRESIGELKTSPLGQMTGVFYDIFRELE